MKSIHVKKGDNVVVLTGKDAGKQGKVIACYPDDNRCSVEGVHIMTKHQKARKQGEQSRIVKKEGTINASNVQIVCPACNKATRIANVVNAEGVKHRTCKKCGAVVDQKRVAKEEKAAKAAKAGTAEKPVKESKAKKTAETAEKPAKAAKTAKTETEVKPVKETKAKAAKAETAETAEKPAKVSKPKAPKEPKAE